MNAIARQLGITHAAALASARTIAPGLLDGLRDYPGGINSLLELAGRHGGEQLAATVMGHGALSSQAGEEIIAQIGGIAVSGGDLSDDDAALRLKMAPLLAMLVAGFLWARAATGELGREEIAMLLAYDEIPDGSGIEPV